MKKYLTLALFLSVVCLSCSKEDDNSPTITFLTSGGVASELSRNELLDVIPSYKIEYYDTLHQKNKTMRAFSLRDVIVEGFGFRLSETDGDVFRFLDMDGGQLDADRLLSLQFGGYVGFEDLDVTGIDNWEPIASRGNDNPAPFYIFWKGETQIPQRGYPWTYRVHTIFLTH